MEVEAAWPMETCKRLSKVGFAMSTMYFEQRWKAVTEASLATCFSLSVFAVFDVVVGIAIRDPSKQLRWQTWNRDSFHPELLAWVGR